MRRTPFRVQHVTSVILASVFVVAACAPAAAPQQPAQPAQPAAQPAKPAAPPQQPAAQPAKPAAQPAKPVEKPAEKPAKPAAKPVVELRAGSTNVKESSDADALDHFAELVAKKTNGEVLVRVFYQSLGVEHQLTQSVQVGSVDIGQLSDGNSSRFSDAYHVFALPFLFKSTDNMMKVLDSPVGRKQIAQFEKDIGVKLLLPIGFGVGRDVQTRNKPLRVPADIKGLKIRAVSTPVDLATYRAWGANPTPIDWGQTYSALQQGVVDGENLIFPAILWAKHYEIIKHSIRLDYQGNFQQVFINAKKLASLSPEHQKALLEAAAETKPWQLQHEKERVGKAEAELTKLGVNIYHPTPAEYQQWASIREKVWTEVAEQLKDKIDLRLANELYQAQ